MLIMYCEKKGKQLTAHCTDIDAQASHEDRVRGELIGNSSDEDKTPHFGVYKVLIDCDSANNGTPNPIDQI